MHSNTAMKKEVWKRQLKPNTNAKHAFLFSHNLTKTESYVWVRVNLYKVFKTMTSNKNPAIYYIRPSCPVLLFKKMKLFALLMLDKWDR